MCEYSTMNQSEAELRREARRRKILENSASRLKLIEGIHSSSGNSQFSESNEQFQNKEEKYNPNDKPQDSASPISDCYSILNHEISQNKELRELSAFLKQSQRKDTEEDEEEVEEEVETKATAGEERKNETWLYRFFFEKKLHYILLAVIVNAFLFFNIGYLFYENIFCPFYTVKFIELLSRRKNKEEAQSFFSLLIVGFPKKIYKFTKKYLNFFSDLISDLFLYIFIFIVGTKIINIPV